MKKRKFTLIEVLLYISFFGLMCSYVGSLFGTSFKTKQKLDEVSQRNFSIEAISTKFRIFTNEFESPVKLKEQIILATNAGIKVTEDEILFIEKTGSTLVKLPPHTTITFSRSPSNDSILMAHILIENGKKKKKYTVKAAIGKHHEK